MKAPAYTLQRTLPTRRLERTASAIEWLEVSRKVARWTLSISPGVAILLAALWAASTPAVHDIYSAAIWATGFVFIALAVESRVSRSLPLLATGLALPVLGLLGSRIAMEFSILATLIVAVWLALWILRRE